MDNGQDEIIDKPTQSLSQDSIQKFLTLQQNELDIRAREISVKSQEEENRKSIAENQVVLYQRGASNIELFSSEGAELLLLGGQPHNEPVYAYGPFVMNTESEIEKCYRDYQSGRMGNPDVVNMIKK